MNFLSLDISMRTGWAIFYDGKLLKYDSIKELKSFSATDDSYPYNFLVMAEEIAQQFIHVVKSFDIEYIVIEETNKATERFSQKKLEFIHCCFAKALKNDGWPSGRIKYIDSSAWRKKIELKLLPEHRQHNNLIRSIRKEKRAEVDAELIKKYEPELYELTKEMVKKREINKVAKEINKKCRKEAGKMMAKFRVRIDNKVATEINKKTLAVAHANKKYNLQLKIGDNDIADAICLGDAFISGAR